MSPFRLEKTLRFANPSHVTPEAYLRTLARRLERAGAKDVKLAGDHLIFLGLMFRATPRKGLSPVGHIHRGEVFARTEEEYLAVRYVLYSTGALLLALAFGAMGIGIGMFVHGPSVMGGATGALLFFISSAAFFLWQGTAGIQRLIRQAWKAAEGDRQAIGKGLGRGSNLAGP